MRLKITEMAEAHNIDSLRKKEGIQGRQAQLSLPISDNAKEDTMYNSSYFQRGGNNLVLGQIARTGGGEYDC